MVSPSKKNTTLSSSPNINCPAISITDVSSSPSGGIQSNSKILSSPKQQRFFPAKSPKKKSADLSSHEGDFSIGDYNFSYEAVLDDEDTRQCLLKYMKTIRCEESLLFLDQVNMFNRKRSTLNKWSMIQSIYEQFFCEHSKYELNLPQRVRDLMIHTYLDIVEEIAHRKRMNHDDDTSSTCSDQLNIPKRGGGKNRNSSDDLESKDVTITSLDYVDLSDCEDALKQAESYILINLKEYVFPKFVASDLFQEFISKKTSSQINTIGTVKALSHSCFVESLMDMKKCEINVDKVRMIKKHVFDDRYWDCIYHKDTTYGYISSKKYTLGEDDNAKGVYFAKCEVIFPYSAEQIMNIMTNTKNRIEHDKNLESIKRIGYRNKSGTTNYIQNLVQSEEEDDTISTASSTNSEVQDRTANQPSVSGKTKLATTLTHERYRLGWPIKSRYYLLAQSMVYDSTDNMYIIAKKSCEIPNYEPNEGSNIEAINIGCWMFQPMLDENQKECCKYIQFVGTDLRGSIPTFIIEKIVRKRTRYFYESTMKMIKACEVDSTTRPQDSSGYFETLDENGSIAL